MESLITQYGLAAVFLGAAVEGDVVMLLSGVAAHLGLLHFPLAVASGWCGAVAADCLCYAIGRTRSAQAAQTRVYRLIAPRISDVAGRLGAGEIVVARFIFGTRVVSMLYWGIVRLPFARFAFLDMLGSAIWASVLAGLGYAFSSSATLLVGDVKRAEVWLLVALIVAGCSTVVTKRVLRRSLVHGNA